MPRSPVLVDTWALLALLNKADPWHDQALAQAEEIDQQGRLQVVTEWVLTEFLGGARKPPGRSAAVQYVREMGSSPKIEIVAASPHDWQKAFDLYAARADKSWSLVDCHCILVCQERGISDVFTRDRHFEQAGLRVLLRSTS